jgi:hypothetical protein
VQILGITTANGTTTVTVQHHLVTEIGDTVFIDQAQAIGVFVTPDLFALTNYHFHLSGGTGRFEGATAGVLTENSIALKKGERHLGEGTNSSVSENTCRIAAL